MITVLIIYSVVVTTAFLVFLWTTIRKGVPVDIGDMFIAKDQTHILTVVEYGTQYVICRAWYMMDNFRVFMPTEVWKKYELIKTHDSTPGKKGESFFVNDSTDTDDVPWE